MRPHDTSRRCRYALLIPLLLLAVSIGCSKGAKTESMFKPGKGWESALRTRIKKMIPEPERQETMLRLVDQAIENAEALDREVVALYEDLRKLDRSYDTTPDEFRRRFAKFRAMREDNRTVFIETRFQMKKLATPEEWKRISARLYNNKSGLYGQTFRKPTQ